MGCLYCANDGICYFYDKDEFGIIKNVKDTGYGFMGEGACVVEDDEFPDMNCEAYESLEREEYEEELQP